MSKKGRVNYNFTTKNNLFTGVGVCLFGNFLMNEAEEEGLKSAYVHNNKYEVMKMKG